MHVANAVAATRPPSPAARASSRGSSAASTSSKTSSRKSWRSIGPRPRRPSLTLVRAAKDDLLSDLVRALATQARDKIEKDFNELVVEPFSDPTPGPIPGLVPPSQLADPDSKFISVNVRGTEVVIHYKEHVVEPKPGQGGIHKKNGGPGVDALVCLHGANGSEFSFRRLLPRVAAAAPGTRCIAFDRPPYGLSTRPDAPKASTDGDGVNFVYTAEGQAELTLKLMDALGVETAALLGHSAGAPVALDAALVAPDRVKSYIAVAPAVFLGDVGTMVSANFGTFAFKFPLPFAFQLVDQMAAANAATRAAALHRAPLPS